MTISMQSMFRVDFNELEKIFDKNLLTQEEKLNKQDVIDAYKTMVELRKFEERAADLYMQRKIAGFCHLYIGQEAIATANVMTSKLGDKFITSYRDHGLMLACKADPLAIMGELCGKAIGCSKGKGGSMHMFDIEKNFYGGHGIVGAQSSIGTGLAFAIKYQNQANVCYSYMGDGAAHQGQFYESMNMASLWGLPVIYIIENNEYAMGTSITKSTYDDNLCNRGLSMGILGKRVNGMDFMETYETLQLARKYVISQQRPLLLEMKTYRYRGHSMSDPAKYRTKEEVDQYKTLDPIAQIKHHIFANNFLSEKECEQIEQEIHQLMIKVAAEAVNAAEPSVSELYTDVYSS